MRGRDVSAIFVGRSTLDLVYACARFPEPDGKVDATASYRTGGGPALNAAVAFSALGGKARLCSEIGEGPFADEARADLRTHGVELFDVAAGRPDVLPVSSIILTGAALIREREHGTIEHLLVMPVTPFEIMASKIWAMGLVVLLAASVSLVFVVQGLLSVPIGGSIALFLFGTALYLFAMTSMGIFLATVGGTMPQFGLLLMLVLQPLQMLSGATTPRESMPQIIQDIMLAAPNTHFVILAQAVLFRGAGLAVVWPQIAALLVIGAILFWFSLWRFRAFLR